MIGRKSIFLFLACIALFQPGFSKNKVKVDAQQLVSKEADTLGIHDALKLGDKLFKKGPLFYHAALDQYKKVVDVYPDDDALNYLVGKACLSTNNKKGALKYLLHTDKTVAPDYQLLLARAYHMNLMFDEAISAYGAYRSSLKPKDQIKKKALIDKYIRECDNGFKLVKDSSLAEILPLFMVNSESDDYQPFMALDDTMLFFTSRKSTSKKHDENFYYVPVSSVFQLDNESNSVLSPDKKLNLKTHNTALAYNASVKKFLLYNGKVGSGDLFETALENGKWKSPKPISAKINGKYKDGTGTYLDFKTLVFSSERKVGLGGSDLYISYLDENGKWGEAKNIGQMINTSYDEEVCGAGKDGRTLYFTSEGHNSMGGKDVFVSFLTGNGSWTVPKNLGYPINTPDDDFSFLPIDTTGGLICGYRPEGVGGLDILELKFLYPEVVIDDHFSVKIKVTDRESLDGIKDVRVAIFDVMTDSVLDIVYTDLTGFAYKTFPEKLKIGYRYEADGYHKGLQIFERDVEADTLFFVPLEMDKKVTKVVDYGFSLIGQVSDEVSKNFIKSTMRIYDNTNDSLIAAVLTDTIRGRYSVQLDDSRRPYFIEINSKDYVTLKKIIVFKPDTTASVVYDFAMSPVPVEKSLLFTGRVLDEKTRKAVMGEMKFINPINQTETIVYPDSVTGKYKFELRDVHSMVVEIKADGYFFNFEMVAPKDKSERVLMHDFMMKPIKKGEKIVLNNILFQSGKSIIAKTSYVELDKLVKVMQNSKVNVEISGHTDNTGGYDLNKRLSLARATSVVAYLTLKGIDKTRLKTAGYGPDQPIAENATAAGRSQNRRVEMKILD